MLFKYIYIYICIFKEQSRTWADSFSQNLVVTGHRERSPPDTRHMQHENKTTNAQNNDFKSRVGCTKGTLQRCESEPFEMETCKRSRLTVHEVTRLDL